jgi:DNA mismatch repair protein MutS2
MGDLKSKVKISRLQRISHQAYRDQIGDEPIVAMKGIDMMARRANFTDKLDLRAMRGDEAMAEVEGFLDNALLLGIPEVKILHGKGDGILRRLVRGLLKGYDQVTSIADEEIERGGDGITVVTLK